MKEDYEFEWDSEKAKTNSRKHGISFPEAETIWDDPQALEVHLVSDPEDRWAIIGRTAKNCYLTAIFTLRNSRIRIISARKSTKKEIDSYEKYQ